MFGRSRNTRRLFFCIQARKPPIVKSFGRRQASESRRGTNPRCAGRGLWRELASKRAAIATRRNPLKRRNKFTSMRGPCSMRLGTILVTSFCDESIYWASPTQGAQFGAISHSSLAMSRGRLRNRPSRSAGRRAFGRGCGFDLRPARGAQNLGRIAAPGPARRDRRRTPVGALQRPPSRV